MSATLPLVGWPAIRVVGDHVWQSTLVALVVGLLTLAFRRSRANVRYGLWMAASLKLFVPFAALTAIGSRLGWRSGSVRPAVTLVFGTVSQPFSTAVLPHTAGSLPAASPSAFVAVVPLLLAAIWCGGCVGILGLWCWRWRQVAATVRASSPVGDGRELAILQRLGHITGINVPIGFVSSSTPFEPGIFGIINPVLMWSRGIGERLSDEQIQAVMAHEVAHVRRRDNLTAALHMLVEAIFWFHPMVWWLAARLVDERERACDEEVVRLGHEPLAYAESLLKTCEFYVKSPLVCVAGVTGSDLKTRIERIMTDRAEVLSSWRKFWLAAIGVASLAAPVVVGAMTAPRLLAQSPTPDAPPLAFEAASIKPNKSGNPQKEIGPEPGGRFGATNVPLRDLIAFAYGISQLSANTQIVGGPAWLGSDRFDVVAKAEDIPSNAQMRIMLRTLLADRFKLVAHHEVRDVPTYELRLARGDGAFGPQLRRSPVDCTALYAAARATPDPPAAVQSAIQNSCSKRFRSGSIVGGGWTMDGLASTLPPFVSRVVVDKTGLAGTFDLTLEWTPDVVSPGSDAAVPPSSSATDRPSIFTALQEQLGLKLQSTTTPADVLVIDSVEHPTEN